MRRNAEKQRPARSLELCLFVSSPKPQRDAKLLSKKMKKLKKLINWVKKKIADRFFTGEIDIYNIPCSTVHRHVPLTKEEIDDLSKYVDSSKPSHH